MTFFNHNMLELFIRGINMTYREFSKIIKEKRIAKGLEQKEMAFHLAINKSKYNRIENGIQEPSFIELQSISIILEIDLTEVLELKKPKEYLVYYD